MAAASSPTTSPTPPPNPRQQRSERDALTLRQVFGFLDAARETGDRFEALYAVAIFTGMRPGEMLALRWSDLILDGLEP